MIKRILISVLLFVLMTILVYACFTFYALTPDPHHWTENTRFTFVAVFFVAQIPTIGFFNILYKNKNK